MAAAMDEKVAALESQLAQAKAEADAAAINAEHLSQVMEQRYAALAGEHSQVGKNIPTNLRGQPLGF